MPDTDAYVTSNQATTGAEEFLSVARERFRRSVEAEAENRRLALEDLGFVLGDQWPEAIKNLRQAENLPCLTIPRLKQFVKQVTNEVRLARPALKVSPVDDASDPKTAEIIQGIVRQIERQSSAGTAYNTAIEYAAICGFGYWRVLTDYASDDGFDQDVMIQPIVDTFSVYRDASARSVDGSDWEYAFIVEDVPRDEYRRLYPHSRMASLTDFESIGDKATHWVERDNIRVAEYFYKEHEKRTIYRVRLADGTEKTVNETELKAEQEAAQILGLPAPQVLEDREVDYCVVKWAKINALEILDGNEDKTEGRKIPGAWIPIIQVSGDAYVRDGKMIFSGLVRDAKDSQRAYNYMASYEAETIGMAPRSPYIIAEGQIEGHEKEWRSANRIRHAALVYKETSVSGHPVPPPIRNQVEPPIAAISHARAVSAEDIKATIGIYDASLGARSNETSGIAIRARQQQGSMATMHYTDNLARSLRYMGRQLIGDGKYPGLIQELYQRPGRVARILGEDDSVQTVVLNQPFKALEKGQEIERIYDIGTGKYDVDVSMGPSFATQRQEAAAAMSDAVRAFPALMQVIGDLWVKYQDWPGADQMAERLKKLLPPGIADDGPMVPPQVMQQMAGMQQALQKMSAELAQAKSGQQVEMAKLSMERMKIRAELVKTAATLESKEKIEMLKAELARLDSLEAKVSGTLKEKGEVHNAA